MLKEFNDFNWLTCSKAKEQTVMRLFCFPYAGGGASIFKNWQVYLPNNLEMWAIKLPGRENRVREAPFNDWTSLIENTLKILLPLLDKPYIFFGHSFGARIAYELTKWLQENNRPLPKLLIISACRAPHIPTAEPYLYNLPKNQFIESIRRMNGTPKEFLENDKLFGMMEATLRSDMKLAELWQDSFATQLKVPINIFSGKNDFTDPFSKMQEWQKYTSEQFCSHEFLGDHFFLHSHEDLLVKTIGELVENLHDVTNKTDNCAIDNANTCNIEETNKNLRIDEKKYLENYLIKLNNTDTNYRKDKTIEQLFEEQVILNPEAIAVVDKEQSLTYRQLNQKANQLARYILKKQMQNKRMKDNFIALFLDKSNHSIIALLAILKIGKAYLPLDLYYPQERLMHILKDADINIVISKEKLKNEFLYNDDIYFILLDEQEDEINIESTDNLFVVNHIDNLAYVNYTSGSTGKPKGVAIPHRGVNRLLFGVDYVRLNDKNIFLLLSSMSFDAATFEIWGALLHGSTCILYSDKFVTLKRVEEYIVKYRITILFLTTALFNTIVDENVKILFNVSQILTGGEINSAKHMRKALNELPHSDIISVYGPTESTTFTTYYPVKNLSKEISFVPIGKPISNTRVYLLNENLDPLKIGEIGEIYIGGDGLATGYINNPQLTNEKFIHCSGFFGKDKCLYKTGDLARYVFDDNLEFIGRTDNQVKLNGFRIELNEIEFVLSSYPGVGQSIVVIKEILNLGKQLTAFLIIDETQFKSDLLKKHLEDKLPKYMIPSSICYLNSFPMTITGKVNRKLLSEIDY